MIRKNKFKNKKLPLGYWSIKKQLIVEKKNVNIHLFSISDVYQTKGYESVKPQIHLSKIINYEMD